MIWWCPTVSIDFLFSLSLRHSGETLTPCTVWAIYCAWIFRSLRELSNTSGGGKVVPQVVGGYKSPPAYRKYALNTINLLPPLSVLVQPRSRIGHLAAKFSELIGPLTSSALVQPLPSSRPELTMNTRIPCVRKKFILAYAVLRSLVATHSKKDFSDHPLIFTDASVERLRDPSAVPAVDYDCSGRLSFATFPAIPELAGICLALKNSLLLGPPANS